MMSRYLMLEIIKNKGIERKKKWRILRKNPISDARFYLILPSLYMENL